MKLLPAILGLVAAASLGAAIFLFVQGNQTRLVLEKQLHSAESRAGELQSSLAASSTEKDSLQQRLTALDSDLGDTKSRLTTAETRNVQLTREATQLRAQTADASASLDALKKDYDTIKAELVQTRLTEAAATPEEVARYQQTIGTLQTRVQELELRLAGSNGDTATSVAATSPAPLATARPVDATFVAHRPALTKSAQVLSVGPQSAFVILDFGQSSGIHSGDSLALSRSGQPIARASVSDVRDTYSIAQVDPDSLQAALQKGDTASIVAAP